MSALDIAVAALRGLNSVALVSTFGTLLFVAVIADHPALRRLARISAAGAVVLGIAWLVVDSAVIADADGVSETMAAVPIVAWQTQYGRWFLCRCVLLIVVAVLPARRRALLFLTLVLAGVALAIQPMLGHAGAIGGSVGGELIASEVLHLLAAGAWLGGLLPLFIAVSVLPLRAAAAACRSFTPIGLSAVLLLAGTAIVQVIELMGGLPGLFGTTYGHVALVKLALFIVLLTLAALNRLVLTERVAHGTTAIRISIIFEMLLGIAVIVTAGFLASQTPGTHDQPVWPFPWRPSLDALSDPVLRRELIPALIATGVGVVLAIIGSVIRRIRWYALAAALVILALAVPHLDLLFVEAYPTSFFTSPTEFAATAIVHGSRLFAANCTPCHGTDARGDGPMAKALPVPPADLTAEHFWAHSDGELYWYVSHGFAAPDGSVAMPGFGHVLSTEGIWDVIDYLRAHNGGESLRQTGKWQHPLQVPQFDAACPGGNTLDLDDLRGRVLRIIAAPDDQSVEPPPTAGATTILLTRRRMTRPIGSACVATEPQTWTAFAIILGQSPDALAGWQVLVDRDAWLRAAWHPGEPGDWTNPQVLSSTIRDMLAHPLAIKLASGHVHRH